MNRYVFWDVQSMQDVVLKVNGHSISPTYKAIDMKNYSSSYSTTLDNTGVQVLIFSGTAAPVLSIGNYEVIGVIDNSLSAPSRPIKPS